MKEFKYTKMQRLKDDAIISILSFLLVILEKWLEVGKKIFGENYGNWYSCIKHGSNK